MPIPASHHQAQTELGAQTRERLLNVAERRFAEHGYAATSVRDITREAGSNLASVNYHFGGKLKLYHAVFHRRFTALRTQRLRSIEQAMARGRLDLEGLMREFAYAFLGPLVAAREGRFVVELIAREMLDPQLDPKVFRAEVAEPVQTALITALVATVPGLSESAARSCVFSLVGQLIHMAHRARLDEVVGLPGSRVTADLESLVEHIVRFSVAGVLGCARGPRSVSSRGRAAREGRMTGGKS